MTDTPESDPSVPTPAPDRRPLKTRSREWAGELALKLAAKGITPNEISVAGIWIAVFGFGMLWGAGHWPAGWILLLPAAVCIQGRLLCNMMDGMVAIEGGLKAKGGELFNEVPDRIEDTLLFVGAGYASGYVEAGWLCSVLAIFTAYVRALGASFGQEQDFGGPCAKPHRMFVLTVGVILAFFLRIFSVPFNAIGWTLWLIAGGTALTAVLRLKRIYSKMT